MQSTVLALWHRAAASGPASEAPPRDHPVCEKQILNRTLVQRPEIGQNQTRDPRFGPLASVYEPLRPVLTPWGRVCAESFPSARTGRGRRGANGRMPSTAMTDFWNVDLFAPELGSRVNETRLHRQLLQAIESISVWCNSEYVILRQRIRILHPIGRIATAVGEGDRAVRVRLGGVSAMLVTAILLTSLLSFFIALPGLGLRNWLVVLFEINAGAGGLPVDPLRVLNPLDFAVLLLVGFTFLGLPPQDWHRSRVWWIIAVVLPFAGIALFAITRLAGRSAVMGAGLVIGFLMRKGPGLQRPLAYLGIVANALLLIADFATGTAWSPIVAVIVSIGYILLVAWFPLIGALLLGWGRQGQSVQEGGHQVRAGQ